MNKYKILILFIIGISFSLNAQTTYYIDFENGQDTNNGTSETSPWKHCPGDVNATDIPNSYTPVPGDKFVFRGGVVYEGSIYLNNGGEADNYVIFSGSEWGSEKAIIDGSNILTFAFSLQREAHFIKIDGYEIRNLTGTVINANESTNNLHITNNIIHDLTKIHEGGDLPALRLINGDNYLIENNEIYNIYGDAISIGGNSHDFIVRGNHIYNGNDDGISGGCDGVFLIENNHIHNLIRLPGSSAHPDGIVAGSPGKLIIRNNFVHDITQLIFVSPSRPDIIINDVNIYNNVLMNSKPELDGRGAPANGIVIRTKYAGITSVNIFNNTLVNLNLGSGGIRVMFEGTYHINSVRVLNNIFYNSINNVSLETPLSLQMDHNLYLNNHRNNYLLAKTLEDFQTDNPTLEQNSIYADPGFFDLTINNGLVESYDFHITENSNAKDAGIDLRSYEINIDYDGNIRPPWFSL